MNAHTPTRRQQLDARARKLNACDVGPGPVLYWMSRDQRAHHNWALAYAQELARRQQAPLHVAFCLAPRFLEASAAHFSFMLTGLESVARDLASRQIGFILLCGDPDERVPALVERLRAGALVADFDPLRIKRQWRDKTVARIRTAAFLVDAHNIVPCWTASPKQEFAAYTFRPKIRRLLPDFLTPLPALKTHPVRPEAVRSDMTFADARRHLNAHGNPVSLGAFRPGERAARQSANAFLKKRLDRYDTARNDPTESGQSGLSPYLHFGQLSAQWVALRAQEADVSPESKAAFLEELIVRRELSDNYCHYNERYDALEGSPNWARTTLDAHRGDRRPYLYNLEAFEHAGTHDALWNAAQQEMVKSGKMHGYMRMYWAKKILEWTETPEEAVAVAITLNDRYELDGRDPNGYAGVMWSVAGVHDRAWPQRPVFGKIRYMSESGCRRKFDVPGYIRHVETL